MAVATMIDPATVITGRREGQRALVTVAAPAGEREDLPHVMYHSPDGMDFGYSGSGPADLALSILVYACNWPGEPPSEAEARTLLPYQAYKDEVVAQFGETWGVTVDSVRLWLHEYYERTEDDEDLERINREV